MPKDVDARSIPIHACAHAVLVQFRQNDGYVLKPWKRYQKHGGTVRVYRYDPKKVWQRVLQRVVAGGGRRITSNGMRHSFARNLLMAGVSDTLVARWMGHADTSLVHERYGHLHAFHGDINRMKISAGRKPELDTGDVA